MIPAPMSMYTHCVCLVTHMRMGRGVRASRSQLVRQYMCGQCTVYLSVGSTVELNRFLLPDSREIFLYFFYYYIPSHQHNRKGREKIFIRKKKSVSPIYINRIREKKRKLEKNIFILCRVLFSLHVAPMCIVCDAVSSRVFFSL